MDSKKLTRRGFLRMSAIAGSVALAACTPQVVKETVVVKEEVEKVVEVTRAPGERIRVTWYAWGNPLNPGRYADYEKAFDDYGLDTILQCILVPSGDEYYVKLMAAVASGTAPDCCSLWGEFLRKFIKEDILTDLLPMAEMDNINFDDYWEGMMMPTFREGGWWGWPWGSEPSGILYNETLFKEAGLEMPYDLWKNDAWTWTAFLEAAKAITKVDDQGFALRLGAYDPLNVNATDIFAKMNGGTGWFPEDYSQVTITEPEGIEAVQWVADLSHKHAVVPGDAAGQTIGEGNAWANFQAGVLGMIQMYIVAPGWLTNRGQQDMPFPVNFAPFPRADSGDLYLTTWNHNEVAMTSSTPHPEAAWEFLKFFGSEDGAMVWLNSTWFHVVPNKSVMQADWYLTRVPGFDASVCLEMMDPEMFSLRPEPLEVFKFRDIAGEELDAIRLQVKTVEGGLQSVKDRMDPILVETEA